MSEQKTSRPAALNESPLVAYAAFAITLFGAKLWLIDTYGNATPFWDQWNAEAAKLYEPLFTGSLSLGALVAPHNEHRILTTRLLALALIEINRIWNPLLQMVVNAVLHISSLVLCNVLVARVVGARFVPCLLSFTLVVFALPYAWENTLAGFQAPFYFVLLFSILCLWLTTTETPFSPRWLIGVGSALLAFFSLASGVFALGASAATGLLLYVTGSRRTARQLLAFALLSLLFVACVLATPTLAHHAKLKASSISQFTSALEATLAWPISANGWSAVTRNLPSLFFAGTVLWKRIPRYDKRWFLLALVIWSLGQGVSVAYGRAADCLASRYLDLFAVGVLVNFACMISLVGEYCAKRTHAAHAATLVMGLWSSLILLSLVQTTPTLLTGALPGKRAFSALQEQNTRAYLITNDYNQLDQRPYFHIPFPSALRLAQILQSPVVRSVLPSNVRAPLTAESIGCQPPGAFVDNGYYPTTPLRIGRTVGSYSADGDGSLGVSILQFPGDEQGRLLVLPVAGYPLREGMSIEVSQNGKRWPLNIDRNPAETWQAVSMGTTPGPFTIYLSDFSPTTWLAVGVPFVQGRLDQATEYLLANHIVFIGLGLVAWILALSLVKSV